jgi:hypothetical protein
MLTHSDGSSYEGIWEHGQRLEGHGVFRYPNGNFAVRANYNVNERGHTLALPPSMQ